MRSLRLLKAFVDIDDKHIREAWAFRKKKPGRGRRILPVAACLALAAGLLFILLKVLPLSPDLPGWESGFETGQPPQGQVTPADLPLLQLEFETGGMGFEGYMAYSIDDLVNENPWREDMILDTLPVYKGPGHWAASGWQTEIDLEAMQSWALELAGRLGLSEKELTVGDNRPAAEEIEAIREKYAAIGEEPPPGSFSGPTEVVVAGKGIEITVDARFEAAIFFDPAIPLPGAYNFTYYAGYADTEATAEYLLECYRGLLGMKEPVINICGGDYNIYDEQMYRIEFFEGAGNAAEQIVAYNLGAANFFCEDSGMLYGARIKRGAPGDKLGDYPLISAGAARVLLEEGHFLTTVPADFPGLEYVRRAELIYRSGWEPTLLPYYRFYVEIPGMAKGERKTYGAYYVPAVESRYIQNMPLWDGSFN